ncbi:MAG TPA: PH domain-containing protein [Candidatus Krumholzibacteria bacterium]|nr:PH domain-containing protein [Candidatus Krumholzibacteria bacterium]
MHFDAPWSRLLKGVTLFASVMCVGAALIVWNTTTHAGGDPSKWWTALLPIAVVVGSALFMIRGYTVERDTIVIHRPLRSVSLPRTGVQSATHDPSLVAGSIRVFGNGGFFSFSGWFRNKRLGMYKAYITDPARTVVLQYGDRAVVVSPSDPDRFIATVMQGR